MTFDRPLEAIDAGMLARLVADRVPESRHLEYKEALPGESERDKRDFLADISAFANSAGGDLIYGVREERDQAGQPTGLPAELVGLPDRNLDQERLRLEQLARDGIRPRIPGLRLQPINRGDDPPCLLVRVPRSSLGLHMVTLGGWNRFYARGSGGRYELDVEEIRNGFLAAETAAERARGFRRERLAAIEAGEAPLRLPSPLIAFHVIPLTPWTGWGQVIEAPEALRRQLPTLLGLRAQDVRFTPDGWLALVPDAAFVQLFRWGAIESVAVAVVPPLLVQARGISGAGVERLVLDAYSNYSAFLGRAGIDPPVALALTLTGVREWTLVAQTGPGLLFRVPSPGFDRDLVAVPETVVDDLQQPPDVALRPLFDALWNAAGEPRSPHYKNGRWQGLR